MFEDLISKALPQSVKQSAGALAIEEANRLSQHPGLDAAMQRRARRDAAIYAAQQLGLPQPLRFATVYDFFDDYLAPAFEVQDRNQEKRWCSYWWDHRTVLHRIEAMWRKYEKMRLTDPAGADEEFLRIVIDHHMPVLLGPQSPMSECDRGKAHAHSRRLSSTPREDDQ